MNATNIMENTNGNMINEEYFPENIPGFDLKAGLTRFQGNTQLYKKLLLKFSVLYLNAVKIIDDLITAKQYDKAEYLVNKLKGSAINIDAVELTKLVINLENAIQKKNELTIFLYFKKLKEQNDFIRDLPNLLLK